MSDIESPSCSATSNEKSSKAPNRKGTRCCVPNCKSYAKQNPNLSWNRFPTDNHLKKEWIKRINRRSEENSFQLWKPTSFSCVCGMHFNLTGKKGPNDILPRYHLTKGYTSDDNNEVLVNIKRKQKLAEKKKILAERKRKNFDQTNALQIKMRREVLDVEVDSQVEVNVIDTSKPTHILTNILKVPFNEDIEKDLKKQIKELDDRSTLLLQELKMAQGELEKLKKRNRSLEDEISKKNDIQFRIGNILKDSKKLEFYTGFTSINHYMAFTNFVIRGYHENYPKRTQRRGRDKALSTEDQLFLILCRLRLGLLEKDLAHRFNVSESTVSSLCNFWIPFIAKFLRQVPLWMSREVIDEMVTPDLKEEIKNTRVILDATELYTETPSSFDVQSTTYSQYKSHCTAKGLVGIAPNGAISFVSDLAPGRKSDKELTKESGILDLLEKGDSIMADRGFVIEEELREIGVELNIPPFMRGKSQLSPDEEKQTRKIAKFRIHVERVIRCIKTFRILKYIFPNSMADQLNDYWIACVYISVFCNDPLLERSSKFKIKLPEKK